MSDVNAMTNAEATANAFVAARRDARALVDYPGQIPTTLEAAYCIQDAAIQMHGGDIAGWKVGRIQPPLDIEFGTTRLAGPIFGNVVHSATPPRDMPVFLGGFGAIEAEFLFKLGDLPAGITDWSIPDALACVTAVHIGFEIASSPFAGINRLGPTVTASDFGNNNGLLVGPPIANWRDRDIDGITVVTRINGDIVGTGAAASFPGGCGGSIAFLLENLARRRIALAPGTWVSTGAVTGVHEIAPGSIATAEFGDLTGIECRIVAAQASTN